jgi:hypothetical protein
MTKKICILQDDGERLGTKITYQVPDAFGTLNSDCFELSPMNILTLFHHHFFRAIGSRQLHVESLSEY